MSRHETTAIIDRLERQVELQELSISALQKALKMCKKRSAKRMERIRDLLNQNHRLEAEGPSRFRRHGQRGEGD